MKLSHFVSFAVGTLLVGLILHYLPFNESEVASHRMERLWTQEGADMRSVVKSRCDQIATQNDTPFERMFLGWLAFDEEPATASSPCTLVVQVESVSRFELRDLWAATILVERKGGEPVLFRTFTVDTPRPLCLLPVLVFVLALFFEVKLWKFSYMLVTYLFMLSGFNLIRMFSLIKDSALITITADQSLLGFTLVMTWIALSQSHLKDEPKGGLPYESTPLHPWLNRAIATVAGLWNPIMFTLFGRVLVTPRSGWIFPFLDAQFLFAALSLYLLSVSFENAPHAILHSLQLPRYFTFTALFLFAINLWVKPARKQRLVWKLPNFWRAIAFIAVIELAKYFIPALRSLNSLTRFGVALVASELVWPRKLHPRETLRALAPWVAILFIGMFITVVSFEAGIIDLALNLLNPRLHPRLLYLFSFLAGSGLGFITGSFSAAFFPLYAFMQSPHVPMIKAAMLDGVIAGLMVSPLSLFNLLPALQFRIGVRKLISFRIRQVLLPFLIGVTIYSIAAFTSVGILQPVTFVFCLLLAFAFSLRRAAWQIRMNRSLLSGN